ncbi:TetR/AcrR family transcriptional regulator [Euzebya rosea]|uniref:TetR/AcrR family transcriptional regulator n=1 Tax=Euzebya rosea TaxID=2052804 RepID=UPI00147654F0|nr:TetR family transcriptional regulator [Euzebya rosea]
MSSTDDRSTRARIRDAAIEAVVEAGPGGLTARNVAARAGVSAGSVIHHFGSMDELRDACDHHIVSEVRRLKAAAMARGAQVDPIASLRDAADGPPLMAYLARTMVDGTPRVTDLVREMVADAVVHMKEGAASGLLNELDDPEGCATILTIWSLGALVLHDHVEALLGVDLLSPSVQADPTYIRRYMAPAFELLSGGMVTAEAAAGIAAAMAAADTTPADPAPTKDS